MTELAAKTGVNRACEALAVPRSQVYRDRQGQALPDQKVRISPGPSLSSEKPVEVRETFNSERLMDKAPRQEYATLLDEGTYG